MRLHHSLLLFLLQLLVSRPLRPDGDLEGSSAGHLVKSLLVVGELEYIGTERSALKTDTKDNKKHTPFPWS